MNFSLTQKCSALLSKDIRRDDFLEYTREEYDEIRQDYFDGLKDKKYLSLAEARKRKLKIDWASYEPGKILDTSSNLLINL